MCSVCERQRLKLIIFIYFFQTKQSQKSLACNHSLLHYVIAFFGKQLEMGKNNINTMRDDEKKSFQINSL